MKQRLKGGTTAVVTLIRGNLLLTAWLGDSQAVLVRDGVATQLVNPHKPDRSVSYPNTTDDEMDSFSNGFFFVVKNHRTRKKEYQTLVAR